MRRGRLQAFALAGLAAAICLESGAARAQTAAPALAPALRTRLERLISTRGFTRGVPRNAVPSPDGTKVYFLRSGPTDQYQRLYEYDVASGQERVLVDPTALGGSGVISKEEQARRERQRQTERGVTSFQVSQDGRLLLVPYSGNIDLVHLPGGEIQQLTNTPEPEIDPHLSPDGEWVSFVRGNDLFVLEIASGHEAVVAHSTDPGIAYGVAEFVAQEEMDRSTGHWWAPNSEWLAFTSVDSRSVPTFRVPDFSDPTGEGTASAYPKAGDPNAVVTLYAIRIGSSSFRHLDLGDDVEYLARVHWSPASDAIWAETQPRSQKRVDVRRVSVRDMQSAVVFRDEGRDWVNLNQDFRFLSDGKRVLWASERTGHKHLEIHTGSERRAITSGNWDVTSVLDVDEAHGTCTFSGTRDGVLQQHIYRVALKGGPIRKLTAETGWHDASFHPQGHAAWVETWSDDRTPPRVRVRNLAGDVVGTLVSAAQIPSGEDSGPAPEFLHFEMAQAGPLDVRIVRPHAPNATSGARVPLIVYVYAGPHAQQVNRAWGGERGLFDGWLADQGFAVARIDGRGVRARGHASEHIFAGRLGGQEVVDQVAGVRALCARFPELDPARVGIWGWSYGGYMTLRALERAHDTFKVGVAVAPVVDWHGYDTHYTERYLGLPSQNAAGYDSSSTLVQAADLAGRLVLVHGATDDNVHFRESMQLVRKLQEQGTQFDLMVYPGTHMMESLAERMHLYELIWRAFATKL